MFLRNNEKIDTEILRNRVLLEINRLKRQMTNGPAAAASLGKSGVALQQTSQQLDTEANLAAATRQVIHKISTWLWCFVHLPRIYTTAYSTKPQIGNLDHRLTDLEQKVNGHLQHLEQRVSGLEQWVNGHQEQWIAGLERKSHRC